MTARLSDLVVEDRTGKLSSRKLWFHIGNTIASGAFVADTLAGNLTDLKLLVYLVGVGGSTALLRFVELRYAHPRPPDDPE